MFIDISYVFEKEDENGIECSMSYWKEEDLVLPHEKKIIIEKDNKELWSYFHKYYEDFMQQFNEEKRVVKKIVIDNHRNINEI